MITLSIRQPWAWLIIRPDLTGDAREEWLHSPGRKDIENRSWSTVFRGRLLVHAGKGMTRAEYESAADLALSLGQRVPNPEDLQRGGVIGSVELADCVTESASGWFFGEYGFVLRDPRPLPFVPWKGQLSFFDVPRDALREAAHG
ncbi:ASCH domain-containing protein [Piscinibacter defluvii]|uniref:ASCH domain-containing protein n=1 Tax=Piscinibacter defluvii TaxID=1796922 RepID=UPI00197C273A|nr:ASCH domain-containing protein [Piscinibacter defluvii]